MIINFYFCWDINFFSSFNFFFIEDITLDFLNTIVNTIVNAFQHYYLFLYAVYQREQFLCKQGWESFILIKMLLRSYSSSITSHWYMMLIW